MKMHVIIFLLAGLAAAGIAQPVSNNVALGQSGLIQRIYSIDPGSLLRVARRSIVDKEIHPDAAVMRSYFKQNGIDTSAPSSFQLNYVTRSLIVSSSPENLARIEALLPPPLPPRPVMYYACTGPRPMISCFL